MSDLIVAMTRAELRQMLEEAAGIIRLELMKTLGECDLAKSERRSMDACFLGGKAAGIECALRRLEIICQDDGSNA